MAEPAGPRHGQFGQLFEHMKKPPDLSVRRPMAWKGVARDPGGSGVTGANQRPLPKSRAERLAARTSAPGGAELDSGELAEGEVDGGQKMAKRSDDPVAMKHLLHDMVLRLRLR